MKVEISNGELLDKVSILEIKLKNITNEEKLVNIKNEFKILKPLAINLFNSDEGGILSHYRYLIEINSELWKIEDDIRECEKNNDFGPKFIELARNVYITNDKRCDVKKLINITTGSKLVEEKSYEDYTNEDDEFNIITQSH
tara:strand:- start:132 stop:557 length:426 start_codon:yes stop_codon:yes gene_type:complete